jgi:glycogen(starch) synthase
MKIWILASETPVFNPGGIARYVDNFARFLARAGHTVLVFGREEEAVDQEIEPGYRYRSVVPLWNRCGEKTDSPRPDEHPSWPYNILDYWGAFSFQMRDAVLEEIAASGPPDVIESQEYGALPYYLLQHKLTENSPLRDIPIVVNCHSPDFICRRFNEEPRYQMPNYWIGRMEMASLHAADALICPSDYLSRQLEEEFGDSISVRHFPLPWTDPKQFGADAIQVDSKKAVYFGRLEIRKGVLKLLDECTRALE